ncbi:MAG: hypothetical protein WD801_11255 [Gemmatimonadaceae bacterium]
MVIRNVRRVALVGAMGDRRVAVHTAGYPMDPEAMLPPADVVLLVADGKASAMLFRYSAHGELCGDTPHDSAHAAQDQAILEYGDALMEWMDVPPDVTDAHAFAVAFAADQLNQREE